MKNLRFSFTFCLGLFSILLLSSSCGEQSHAEPQSNVEGYDTLEEDSISIPLEERAISIWQGAGLRKEAGKNAFTKDREENYMTSIAYGEAVQMLGQTDTLKEDGRTRVYMKIRLQDGKEGWTDEYLFEKHARRAVVVVESDIYRRPDVMTLRPIKVVPGEIIVAMEQKDGWIHVSGPKKRKKGWIKVDQGLPISHFKRDLQLANMFRQAKRLDGESRVEALTELIEDEQYKGSVLMVMVQELLAAETAEGTASN